MLLIAESKMGGLEGRIARAKLRALKKQRQVTADMLRRQILARLLRARASPERDNKADEHNPHDGEDKS